MARLGIQYQSPIEKGRFAPESTRTKPRTAHTQRVNIPAPSITPSGATMR